MDVDIRPVREEDDASAYAFQCEYLDRESRADFANRMEAGRDWYLGAFLAGELVGVCYGAPSRREAGTAQLQGIAVNLDETRRLARKEFERVRIPDGRLAKSIQEQLRAKHRPAEVILIFEKEIGAGPHA
ncbi:hypothetical protein [Cohnella sp. REN36]|uniref:hypothetical protein n=1 Tax=Cohnella sp. REN36 TaxID=2887347 RepID=UPI001D13AD97|nr:hypothetical protein [Cohnella sp. REN36]MCC3373810.1 hypothetical protein [Cohnella sp. REN36]